MIHCANGDEYCNNDIDDEINNIGDDNVDDNYGQ